MNQWGQASGGVWGQYAQNLKFKPQCYTQKINEFRGLKEYFKCLRDKN